MPEEGVSTNSRTVLVVDGHSTSRDFFVRAMQTFGFTVLEAANKTEAMELCHDQVHYIDLLIAEFVLADAKGTQLAANVREHCPNVPVLLTSSLPLDEWRENERTEFADLGVGAAFLPKPFHISKLKSKLAYLLSRQARLGPALLSAKPHGAI
jgi:DNA-binding response OmpR family regulator